MKKVAMFLVDGFEDMEAIAPLDILRRANIAVDTISINENNIVLSSRNVKIMVDKLIDEIDFDEYDVIVLPGGPGVKNYYNSNILLEKIKEFEKNKLIAGICAAPTVFASLGLLKNKRATCYPSCKETMLQQECEVVEDNVVVDGNVITSRGAGTSIDFGLKLVEILLDNKKMIEIKKSILYNI